jgi:hypothetical protein
MEAEHLWNVGDLPVYAAQLSGRQSYLYCLPLKHDNLSFWLLAQQRHLVAIERSVLLFHVQEIPDLVFGPEPENATQCYREFLIMCFQENAYTLT